MRRVTLLAGALLVAVRLDAATLDVCSSGCTYNNFQTAINAAVSGDTITLRAGQTFTGAFTLPNKANAAVITIKSDASAGNLPGVSVRTSPAYAAFLPKIQSSGAGSPAVQILASARNYTFENVEFLGSPGGFYNIVLIGNNDGTQTLASQEPFNIKFDRVYMHADPVVGQKRGIFIASNHTTIRKSYFDDINAVGEDSQVIGCSANSSGDLLIDDNFIRGGTENIICGGSDPWERTYTTVTGSGTTLGAAVATAESGHTLAEFASGQPVAVEVSSGNVQFAQLTAQPGSGTTGTLAWSPAVTSAPGVGNRIRGGVQATTITITGNHITKKLSWMTDGVLTRPVGVSVSPSTASGALPAGSRWYRVQATQALAYNNNPAWSDVSTEVKCDLTATGRCDFSWSDIVGESAYRIWCFAASGAASGTYIDVAANTTSYSDTGAIVLTGAYLSGTRWQEKNLLEFKTGKIIIVSGNVFENQWKGSDIGSAIWIKNVNQDGGHWWGQTSGVTITNNIFRHIDGWIEINAREAYGNPRPQAANGIIFSHNLVYDSNATWANGSGAPCGIRIYGESASVTIEHNTVVHDGTCAVQIGGDPGSVHTGLIIRNNLFQKGTYGLIGDGTAEGTAALTTWAPSAIFSKNGIADCNGGVYPATTTCEPAATWQAEFVSYSADGTNADYHLKTTSIFHNAGTDGTDLGADLAAVFAATATAVQGVTSAPPTITTTGLPNAIRNVAYPSTTLTATGGTLPYTWGVNPGSTLPTGLAFSTGGVLTGTPTASAGPYTFTLKVTDNAAQIATATYTITIATGTAITTTTLSSAETNLLYSATLAATGDAAPYTWSVTSGSVPTGMSLTAAGVLSGTPTFAGTSNFSVQALGSLGSVSAPQALSLTVSTEARPCDRNIANNRSEGFFFRRRTAPTATECVMRGDIWMDTSTADLKTYKATAVGPVVWTAFTVASLTGDGSAIINLNASELKNGTIPASAFPNVMPPSGNFQTSVGAPLINGDYLVLNPTACATLSSAGSMRLCADAASGQLKASVNGAAYQSIASPAGAIIQNGNAFGAPIVIGTTDAQPMYLQTSGSKSVTVWINGDVYLDPNLTDDALVSAEIDHTADDYGLGFTTANGKKMFLRSTTGSLREAMGLSDCATSTDYFWGASFSTNSGSNWTAPIRTRCDGWVGLAAAPWVSSTAPTISSGFNTTGAGTVPAIEFSNGTAVIVINTGNGTAASSGVIGMPAATTGWACAVNNITAAAAHRADNTRQTASTTTSVTLENQTTSTGAAVNWTALDRLRLLCQAF